MKNRSPSFPKKVAEKNRERWVVYYFDTDKQKRWARRFSTEAEALEFFREKNIYDEKLGVETNRISVLRQRLWNGGKKRGQREGKMFYNARCVNKGL